MEKKKIWESPKFKAVRRATGWSHMQLKYIMSSMDVGRNTPYEKKLDILREELLSGRRHV